jgi:hypothetical protein
VANVIDHGAPSRPYEIKREAQIRHKEKAYKSPEGLLEIDNATRLAAKRTRPTSRRNSFGWPVIMNAIP